MMSIGPACYYPAAAEGEFETKRGSK